MSLLKRFFGGGGGDPMAPLRRAAGLQRWAEVINLSASIRPQTLGPEAEQECTELTRLARNRLAELNLDEAEAFLRAGDLVKVRDHLALATEFAADDGLRMRMAEVEKQIRGGATFPRSESGAKTAAACAGSCQSHVSGQAEAGPGWSGAADPGLDLDAHLELVLAGYPPVLVDRYLGAAEEFRRSVLLVHEGTPEEALAAFAALPESARNEDYHFELAMLLLGDQRHGEAISELRTVLAIDPQHPLAEQNLVQLLILAGELNEAQEMAETWLTQGRIRQGFAHGRLAAISALRQDREGALRHGLAAVDAGYRDPETILMAGSLLESAGRLDQAEQVLGLLGGSGCGSSHPIPLAEFWLRHNRRLDQALEAFKGALRQDPGNRFWPLRIAQVYLAKGWRSEGEKLVQQLLGRNDLSEEMRDEATDLLGKLAAAPK